MMHADYCDPPDVGFPARPTRVYRVEAVRDPAERIDAPVAIILAAPRVIWKRVADLLEGAA